MGEALASITVPGFDPWHQPRMKLMARQGRHAATLSFHARSLRTSSRDDGPSVATSDVRKGLRGKLFIPRAKVGDEALARSARTSRRRLHAISSAVATTWMVMELTRRSHMSSALGTSLWRRCVAGARVPHASRSWRAPCGRSRH